MTVAILSFMYIMFFGVSFGPPHVGHQYIARFIIEQKLCD